MHKSLSLRLPFPPSLNRIWRAVGGRVILSAAAREWAAAAARALPAGRVVPMAGRLIVTMRLTPPASLGARAWDVANREKLLCDLLTKQRVWIDDEQIDALLIVRAGPDVIAPKGYVDILIKEY